MKSLHDLLNESSASHNHLCPRQILGVRLGLVGMHELGFCEPPANKRVLVITETDGCFADGLAAATGCTVGHRTLRVEDYGKTAAVFVDTVTGQMLRVAPKPDIRQIAYAYAPGESRHYFAQMQAYQIMPDQAMFTLTAVVLNVPIAQIVSRPGVRVTCDACQEEIINEREIKVNGLILCQTCSRGGYYREYASRSHTVFSRETHALPLLTGKD